MLTSDAQTFADLIDQLDLAFDQLVMKDRNFDRFALMLVDNVVELFLHTHATELRRQGEFFRGLRNPKHDPDAINAALGQRFDAKVKLARTTGLISAEVADTVACLHGFRNTAYHRGMRHEGILHSLALMYFRTVCAMISGYSPPLGWSTSSRDQISHRAMKYLGPQALGLEFEESIRPAFDRLRLMAESLGDTLITDLGDDMEKTVRRAAESLEFVEKNQPEPRMTRDQLVVRAQVWSLAFSDEGKAFAANGGAPNPPPLGPLIRWLETNYSLPVRSDPIPSWERRLASLREEKNPHAALKKYCDFMYQSEDVRDALNRDADLLDDEIERRSEEARGK
jgi:hypothetical protein